MVTRANVMGLLAALSGILIFKASTFIPFVENQIKQHPFIVISIALGVFFYRGQIADYLGVK